MSYKKARQLCLSGLACLAHKIKKSHPHGSAKPGPVVWSFFYFFSWSKRWTTLHLNAWFLVSKEVVGKLDKGFLI